MEREVEIQEFEGPPRITRIKPGSAGVNMAWLEELSSNPPPMHRYWSQIVRLVTLYPRPNGTTPQAYRIASEVGVSNHTVMRELSRFEQRGLIYRINLNGLYAYNPDLVVVRDRAGTLLIHQDIYGRLPEESAPG